MVAEFGAKSPLDQGFLQLLEKPVLARQILRLRIAGKQLIKKFRRKCRFHRHVSLR
jgi:hypothetical protein